MSEEKRSTFRVSLRSALEGKQPIIRHGMTIEAMPEGHVIQVLSKVGDEDLSDYISARLGDHVPLAIRSLSPGQWFIVGNAAYSHSETAALCSAFRPKAEGVDQSHGRVRICVKGPFVERMLAKGTAVDLAISAFPTGHATTTLIGHIAAHMTRIDAETFEIMVLRGFAESLWDDLTAMSLEFS